VTHCSVSSQSQAALLPPCLVLQVDNSIVEVFAQHGRTCLTARVYPTLARGDKAWVTVWNEGVGSCQYCTRRIQHVISSLEDSGMPLAI